MYKIMGTSRTKLLQLVHVAKKKLGLSDDEYQTLIASIKTNASSCTDLSLFQIDQLYQLLKKIGFKPTPKTPTRHKPNRPNRPNLPNLPGALAPKNGWATPKQLHYIRLLWQRCSRSQDEASLNKICLRLTHIGLLDWLDKDSATKVILALRDLAQKAGYDPDSLP